MTDEELRRALRAPLTLTVMAELARKGLVSVYPAVETRAPACPHSAGVPNLNGGCRCVAVMADRLRFVRDELAEDMRDGVLT